MAPKKITRAPYTPKAVRPTWTNQTIRLAVRENKRLKRAALKQKMSFNLWAVNLLTDAANRVLDPPRSTDVEVAASHVSYSDNHEG
jgi:hypothetical protein